MIEKLEQEAAEAAELKQWCDKEIGEATAKKEDATLQKELAELAETQQEMDKVREEEKAIYEKNKPELEQGLKGVKLALKILNDYYAKADKGSASGAGGGI